MSRYSEAPVRLICLAVLAAASVLTACRSDDLPAGSVDSGLASNGESSTGGRSGPSSAGSGGTATGGRSGESNGGSGGGATGGRTGEGNGGTGGITVLKDGGASGGSGGGGGSGGSGSFDGGAIPPCSSGTKSPMTDGCTPAVITQDMDACTRCGDIGYIWDGAACEGIGGCACLEGCARVFKTKDECNLAHRECPKR